VSDELEGAWTVAVINCFKDYVSIRLEGRRNISKIWTVVASDI
jgi:hypothetical protein